MNFPTGGLAERPEEKSRHKISMRSRVSRGEHKQPETKICQIEKLRQTHKVSEDAITNLSPGDQKLFQKYGVGVSVKPPFQIIHSAIEQQVILVPDSPAVRHDGEELTYKQLNDHANRLAEQLQQLNVGAGDCVGIFLERSVPMVVGILASLKTGAAYAPQHAGVAPEKQLKHIVQELGVKVILTLEKFRDQMPAVDGCVCICIDTFMQQPQNKSRNAFLPTAVVDPDNTCLVLFTSGTTGTPNGVQVTHKNLCNILLTSPGNLGIKTGETVSQLLSISFDMAAWEILGCLSHGATLLIRGKDFTETASQADVVIATPTILSRINADRCSGVRIAAVAGEPCPKPLADTWASFCDFYNSCGPTETTIVNTMHLHTADGDLSIGKPTPNNTVYILDSSGQPCAIGEVGEMWAGGDCVTAGYLKNPKLTGDRYRYDRFLKGHRMMFNTRDLGRWTSDGNLEHHGRTDDQVKVRGFRVELDSVSEAMESVPGCIRAATLKYDDSNLVGFVSPETVSVEKARAAVNTALPYYCEPAVIRAVPELPSTSRGKIDRKALLQTISDDEIKAARLESKPRESTLASTDSTQQIPSIAKDQQRVLDTESYSSVELPAANDSLAAKATHHKFYHYWRLFVAVFMVNFIFLGVGIANGWWSANAINLTALSNLVVGNITMAIVMRQQYVINLLFRIATSTPLSAPLKFRQLMGKVYHFGGLHLGGAIAGTVWLLVFSVSLIVDKFNGNSAISTATLVVTIQLLILLWLICLLARPVFRQKFHNSFEIAHRFGGWTALALFWLQMLLFVNDSRQGSSFGYALVNTAAFWALILVTLSIALPWLRLKRVPVEIVRPSGHVALVNFDYGVTPFAGSSTTISRSPLTEWHSFANVPAPGKTGFRLTISRAGDWTGRLIDDMPDHVWVKGIPTAGVGNVDKLFKRVVWIATGSGIGPTLPHLLSMETPAHLVWSTRNARTTYGDQLVDEILAVEPNALIWDTDERGRPDLIQLAYAATQAFDAEAVIVIANEKLTRMVVHGMESRGIPAYGAIWDS